MPLEHVFITVRDIDRARYVCHCKCSFAEYVDERKASAPIRVIETVRRYSLLEMVSIDGGKLLFGHIGSRCELN